MTLFVGDQTAETLASRPVRGPLKRLRDSVNSHLQFYYKKNALVPVFRRIPRFSEHKVTFDLAALKNGFFRQVFLSHAKTPFLRVFRLESRGESENWVMGIAMRPRRRVMDQSFSWAVILVPMAKGSNAILRGPMHLPDAARPSWSALDVSA